MGEIADDVTQMLLTWSSGESGAEDSLFPPRSTGLGGSPT